MASSDPSASIIDDDDEPTIVKVYPAMPPTMAWRSPLAGPFGLVVHAVSQRPSDLLVRYSSSDFEFRESIREHYYHGIIVMDVIGLPWAPTGRIPRGEREYAHIAGLLKEIHGATSSDCLAVVCYGFSFVQGSYPKLLEVITSNFKRPSFMVWIALSRDLGPDVQYPEEQLESGIAEPACVLLRKAAQWCREQVLVFGGSSEMWAYQQKPAVFRCGLFQEAFDAEACRLYDYNVNKVVTYVRKEGFKCLTGAEALVGIGEGEFHPARLRDDTRIGQMVLDRASLDRLRYFLCILINALKNDRGIFTAHDSEDFFTRIRLLCTRSRVELLKKKLRPNDA